MKLRAALACLLCAATAGAADIHVDIDAVSASGAPRISVAPSVTVAPLAFNAPALSALPSASAPLAAPVAIPVGLAAAPIAAPVAVPVAAPALALLPAASLPAGTPGANAAAPIPLDAGPSGPLARVRAVLTTAKNWLLPPGTIPGPDSSRDNAYYHGTSLAHLEAAASNGAKLDAHTTYVSNEAGFPYGYARTAARKTGTPGVVLEFSKPAIQASLVRGHWSPSASMDRGKPQQLAQFSMAVSDLPLTALTPASKAAVLAHYAYERDTHPGDAAAQAKLESVAAAVGVEVPDIRQVVDARDLEPGELITPLSTRRPAIFAGVKDGKAILVEGRNGAWLATRSVKLTELTRVLDGGRAPQATLDAVGAVHKLDWSGGSEAEKLDRRFAARDFWAQVAPAARAEIEGLRARRLSKPALKEYVRKEATAAFERIRAARGTANIGFHFNLHGGQREGYVGAGIHASKGDIALRYTPNGDTNNKVYFFQTAQHQPYDALDASNGEIMFFPSRMGFVLSLFAVDHPTLEAAKADGRITNAGSISMDFHKGMRGVPYSAFLAPPMQVFVGTAKKVGLSRLSRDEETLATVRMLEAALLGGDYVPGGLPAASAEAAKSAATARARAAVLAAPLDQIPWKFKLKDRDYLYHGTTLDDLAAVVASGGEMKPEVSMYSIRSADSIGYASERQRKLARPDNPRVLLQFRYDALRSLTSAEPFRSVVMAADRMPPIHAAYVAASAPVPLSLMTNESKDSILSFLRAQADARPDEPKWAALIPKFERAFDASR
jgi:hypothetical protein